MSDTELLKQMNSKLDELLLWRAALDERCVAHREQTAEHRKVLFDNPGLKSKVDRLWNCKHDLKTRRENVINFFMGVLKLLVVAAIVGITVWLLYIYKTVKGA